jgi:hypothetical protein
VIRLSAESDLVNVCLVRSGGSAGFDLGELHEKLDHAVGLGDIPAGERERPRSSHPLDSRYQRRSVH